MRFGLRAVSRAILIGCCAANAQAQSIDASSAFATLGRPLDVSIRVRPTALPDGAFTADCVRAEVSYGDVRVAPEQVRVRTSTTNDPGLFRVRIASPVAVQEPLVSLRVSLLCGAEQSREFTIFADPPIALPQTAADAPAGTSDGSRSEPPSASKPVERTDPAARQKARAARAAARAAAKAARAAAAPKRTVVAAQAPAVDAAPTAAAAASVPNAVAAASAPTVAASAPVAAASTAAAPVQAPASGVRLRLEPAEMEALAATLLRISREQQGVAAAGASGASDGGATAGGGDRLAQEIEKLREENRKAIASIATLQSRLERTEEEQRQLWRQWWPLGAALVLLPLLVWGLRRGTVAGATQSVAARSSRLEEDEGDRMTMPGPEGDLSLVASAERNATAEASLGMSDTTQPAAWARANVGTPSLAVEELEELNHEAHEMISRGYFGAAAALIEEHLQSREAKNPWLLMRLLDLYREMGQPWNYQRVSSQLQTLYNVRVPQLDEADRSGRPLERFTTTLETLKLEWGNPGVVETLRLLLLRPTYIEELDMGAFRELLMLYAIAHEKDMAATGQSAAASVPTSLYNESLDLSLPNTRAPGDGA